MENSLAFSHSDVVFILLINVKMPTIVGILTFMSMINFVLSQVEHEKSFITWGHGHISSKNVSRKFISKHCLLLSAANFCFNYLAKLSIETNIVHLDQTAV